MTVVSLLIAPVVMAAAAVLERRRGPAAAGWIAALPIAFAVAVVAVSLDGGNESASAMALSAATHVPAQVLFGIAFAAALVRHGLVVGVAAGTAAYVGGASLVVDAPVVLVMAGAIPFLALAPRLMVSGHPPSASPPRGSTTALTCVAASAIVGAAVLTSRLAGPEAAGAVAAFPTMCTTLALTVVARDGRLAGAHALTGLVRSLPCYLAFCLVVALAAPSTGAAAVALGLLACVVVAGATWRGIPVTARPAFAN